MKDTTRNVIAALACITVGLYWYRGAQGFRELSRLFPEVVGLVLAILGGVLLAVTVRGGSGASQSGASTTTHTPANNTATTSGVRHYRSATLLGSLILWTLLIPFIGLLPASLGGVTLMGYFTFSGHQGTRRAIIVAGITVILFFALFTWVLRVPFPGLPF